MDKEISTRQGLSWGAYADPSDGSIYLSMTVSDGGVPPEVRSTLYGEFSPLSADRGSVVVTLVIAMKTDLGIVVGADTLVTFKTPVGLSRRTEGYCKIAIVRDFGAVAAYGNTECGEQLLQVAERVADEHPQPLEWLDHLQSALDAHLNEHPQWKGQEFEAGLVFGIVDSGAGIVGSYNRDVGVQSRSWHAAGGNWIAIGLSEGIISLAPFGLPMQHEVALNVIATAIQLAGSMVQGVGTGFTLASVTADHATLVEGEDAAVIVQEAGRMAAKIAESLSTMVTPAIADVLPRRELHPITPPYYLRATSQAGAWELVKAAEATPGHVRRILTVVSGRDQESAAANARLWLDRHRLLAPTADDNRSDPESRPTLQA